jgi:type I restriction enzyme S subunit
MLYPREDNDLVEFFSAIFQNEAFQKSLIGLGHGILVKKSESSGKLNTIRLRISMSSLNRVSLPYPNAAEQSTIVSFLKRKTTKIEQAVAIKEKQIALLKERKQILIQNAVTRGIDPDAPMRDSGVEWIPKIPAHWQVERFKYLFKQSHLPTRENDGVVTSYRDGQVTLRSNRRLDGYTEAILEQGYQGIRKGQLVLNSMDAFEGAIGVSDSDGKCTPEYVICDPISGNVLPEYFAFLLREMALTRYIRVICNAVRQRAVRIRFNNLAKRLFVFPPIEEQAAIVAHIETQSTKIDKTIALQQQQIEKLKEYKATLINSAVTGKIKVPMNSRSSTNLAN